MVSKSWSFTLNNPTEVELSVCRAFDDAEICNMVVIGRETGEEGTPHLQGTMTFRKANRLSAVKKMLERAHWEITRNVPASIRYCRKDGLMLVDRVATKSAVTTDIIWTKAREGASEAEFAELNPTKSQAWTFQYAKVITTPDRDWTQAPTIVWKWGPSGSGKTRSVFEEHGPAAVYMPLSFKWWDGYDRHDVVLIDDFRPEWCTFVELLRLLDRYPYSKEVKGGRVKIIATNFIVTANMPPLEMYSHLCNEDVTQLLRRITRVEEYTV